MSVPKGWTPRGIEYRFSGTFVGAKRDGKLVPFKVSGAGDNYIVGIELGSSQTSNLLYRNADLSFPKLGVVQIGDEVYWVTRASNGYKRGVDMGRMNWSVIGSYPSNSLGRMTGNALRSQLLYSLFDPVSSTLAEAERAILAGEKAGVRISSTIAVAAMRGYIDPGLYYNNQLVGYVNSGRARVASIYDYVGEELLMLNEEVSYA